MMLSDIDEIGTFMIAIFISFIVIIAVIGILSNYQKKEAIAKLVNSGQKYILDANKFKVIESSYTERIRKKRIGGASFNGDGLFSDEDWYIEEKEISYRQLVYNYERDDKTLHFKSDKIFKSSEDVNEWLKKQDTITVYIDKESPKKYHIPLDFLS